MTGEYQDGYNIVTASCNESGGVEKVAQSLVAQIREIEKTFEVECISNAKIDNDAGAGREVYFGYQCLVLSRKENAKKTI